MPVHEPHVAVPVDPEHLGQLDIDYLHETHDVLVEQRGPLQIVVVEESDGAVDFHSEG
jgi:hypothetical protein